MGRGSTTGRRAVAFFAGGFFFAAGFFLAAGFFFVTDFFLAVFFAVFFFVFFAAFFFGFAIRSFLLGIADELELGCDQPQYFLYRSVVRYSARSFSMRPGICL